MRDAKTYRAARRNGKSIRGKKGHRTLVKSFLRLSGDNWKRPFEDKSKYVTPSKNERYWENRFKKFREQDKARREAVA